MNNIQKFIFSEYLAILLRSGPPLFWLAWTAVTFSSQLSCHLPPDILVSAFADSIYSDADPAMDPDPYDVTLDCGADWDRNLTRPPQDR